MTKAERYNEVWEEAQKRSKTDLVVVAERIKNDVNGNPRFNLRFLYMFNITKKGMLRRVNTGGFNITSYDLKADLTWCTDREGFIIMYV